MEKKRGKINTTSKIQIKNNYQLLYTITCSLAEQTYTLQPSIETTLSHFQRERMVSFVFSLPTEDLLVCTFASVSSSHEPILVASIFTH